MMSAYVAGILTLAVLVCHRCNEDWDYLFGILYFAGIPFAFLMEDGLAAALAGYSLGAGLLVFFTLVAYLIEYQATGNWKAGI